MADGSAGARTRSLARCRSALLSSELIIACNDTGVGPTVVARVAARARPCRGFYCGGNVRCTVLLSWDCGSPGRRRCDDRAVLAALRDRLGQCPGGQRGPLTGPNPIDRGKLGSKIDVICDRNGLPISVGISGANLHDSQALLPVMRGIPPIRSRYGPQRRRPAKLHADKGYDLTTCAAGCAVDRSCHASPAAASNRPAVWVGIAGWSSARCLG